MIVTGHQALLTREALAAIAQITLQNIADREAGRPDPARLVKAQRSYLPVGSPRELPLSPIPWEGDDSRSE